MITQQQVYDHLQERNIKLEGTFYPKERKYRTADGREYKIKFIDRESFWDGPLKSLSNRKVVEPDGTAYDISAWIEEPRRELFGVCARGLLWGLFRYKKIKVAARRDLESVTRTSFHEFVHAEHDEYEEEKVVDITKAAFL